MQQPRDNESSVANDVRIFEDNFNVLSQIINNYPTSTYTEGNFGETETDSSITSSANNANHVERKTPSNTLKYYLLTLFSSIYLIYGCQNSLLGPAMSDLAEILHTSSEKISVAMSLKNSIYCISTIFVSFSFKIFGHRQFQYGIAVFAVGIITSITPFLTSFTQYWIISVFGGFFSAFIDSVTNLVVLELFSLNSKIYLQIAHGAFTFGTIFGPLIVGPYLSKFHNSTTPSNHSNNPTGLANYIFKPISIISAPKSNETIISKILKTTMGKAINNSSNECDSDNFQTRIFIPYSIVACLLILSAIIMIASQIFYPYIPEKRKLFAKQKSKKIIELPDEQTQNTQTSSLSSHEISQSSANNISSSSSKKNQKLETVCQQINLPKIYYYTFLCITGLLLSIYSCVDNATGLFMPSFLSKGELKIEKTDAAFMSSVIYMSMATGRLFTIVFALKITCKILLFFNFFMILLSYVTLTFFAVHSKLITWIAMIVIGSGLSSTYPLILSYIENRIVITNTVQLYLLFSSVLFPIFVPIVIGHFIDTAPMMFTYINLFMAIISLILMLLIHTADIWKRKLIKKIKEDQQNLVNEIEN